MSEKAWPKLPPSRVALVAIVACAALVRAVFGLREEGIYWPDEIYQSLEPAHRLVYGYGLIAWEFVEGARNWALPGLVAGVLAVSRAFGADRPEAYLPIVRGFFIAIAAATTWGVHRLARGMGASPIGASAGAFAFAMAAPFVYFGHRAMSETASALPVVLGFALAAYDANTPFTLSVGASRSRRVSDTLPLIAGASLLGVAVLLRLHNAVFCVGLLGILAARREWRSLGVAFATLMAWAFVFGLLDKLTWGGWFHSAFKYLQFNLIEGKAAAWGTAPFGWYVDVLFRCMPAVIALLAMAAAFAAPRALGALLCCAAFFLLHSYTPHKELRFLLPMMPVLCALAGAGLTVFSERVNGQAALFAAGALALASLVSGVRAGSLTFGQIGAYEKERPGSSAWGDFADINRLLMAAGARADLCGLKVEAVHQAWTGGHSYLHREVPYYPHFGPPPQSAKFNYVIAWMGNARGEVVAREGRVGLIRIRPDCVPDPGFNWRLP